MQRAREKATRSFQLNQNSLRGGVRRAFFFIVVLSGNDEEKRIHAVRRRKYRAKQRRERKGNTWKRWQCRRGENK